MLTGIIILTYNELLAFPWHICCVESNLVL